MRTHLRRGYLLRSPLLLTYLATTDALLRAARVRAARRGARWTQRHPEERSDEGPLRAEEEPHRVLLAIGGHLGDAIIAARAVQLLRASFPNIELGIAAPSWSKVALENEPAIRWFHTVDHWRVNRSGQSVASKFRRYARTWRTARSEIEAVGYDLALDLYPYYPNMAGLLSRAGIPRRFGFATGGRGPLYTATAEWVDDRCHIAEKQLRLLKLAFPDIDGTRVPAPRLAPPELTPVATVAQLLATNGVTPGEPYAILHVGGGTPERLWPLPSWRQLTDQLTRTMAVVVTGAGAAEEAAAASVARARHPERSEGPLYPCVNLAGKLNWRQLEALVDAAAVVVSGDTSIAHLAAAHRTPGVAIFSGINDTREWRPLGASDVPLAILSAPVPCAPCYRPNGCAPMTCVRGVSVDQVMAELRPILAAASFQKT